MTSSPRDDLSSTDLPVELVHWPRDRGRRDALVRAGIPLVLLVPHGAAPPERLAIGEDWIRVPADERDLFVRARRVRRQVEQLAREHPVLEDGGLLRRGSACVTLSASEGALVEVLLAAPGQVVDRARLVARVWPDGAPSVRALDALVYRLRRRVAPLGLVVLAARDRGFLLDLGTG